MIEQQEQEEAQELQKREAFSKIYEESLKTFEEGQVVKGTIVSVGPAEVLIDIGYKSEGLVSLEEFLDPKSLKVGDEVEVLLELKENEEGMVILSKRKAERSQGWDRVVAKYGEGDCIEGRVARRVKGGYMVDIGIEAFLPNSQSGLRSESGDLVGQGLAFKIIKVNKQRKNIVLSRKEILLKEREDARGRAILELTAGEMRTGVVKNITDFGAFINLGAIDGLLHITDMSYGRIGHPSEMLKTGETVKVVILDVDREACKVSLGLKQLQPSPWKDAQARYPVGARVKGKIVNILPYGAFVELEPGIEGLVHVSEMSWTRRIAHPSEILAVGQEIDTVVLSIDPEKEKISLGTKQTEENPWTRVNERFQVGALLHGKVKTLTDYGAFVELEEGIDGLVHVSDISWTRRLNHPSEVLKKGQEVDAVVLDVDGANRKISLSIKQTIPDPWPQIQSKYPVGQVVDGRVTKLASFGLFLELEKDVEGLVHVSELDLASGQKMEQAYKVDSTLQARVIRLEDATRKIGLSVKALKE